MLIHLVIILMTMYVIGPGALMTVSLTSDGLFSALEFIINHYRNYRSRELYQIRPVFLKVPVSDRYLIYLTLIWVSLLGYGLFWSYGRYLSYGLLLCLIPELQERLIHTGWYQRYRALCLTELRKCGTYIASQQIARTLNLISETVLGCRPRIHHQEIEPLFENYLQTSHNLWQFAKTFIVCSLIHYVNYAGREFYARVIRLFYFRTIRIPVMKMTVEKRELIRIVMERDLDQLFQTGTAESILYLYQNDRGGNYVAESISQFGTLINYAFFKIITIWSLVSLIREPLLIIPLSCILMTNYRNMPQWIIRIGMLLIQLIMHFSQIEKGGFMAQRDLGIILAIELGYYVYLLFRPIGNYFIQNFRYGKLSRLLTITYHDLLYLVYPLMVAYMSKSYPELLALALIYTFTYDPILRKILLVLGYLFGFVSHYHLAHLSVLSFLAYLGYKLYHQPVRDIKLLRKRDNYLDEHLEKTVHEIPQKNFDAPHHIPVPAKGG